MFYGRKEELEILQKRVDSNRFEFGFIYGQRRIGKTSIIDEFSKTHETLMLFASDSDDTSIRADFSNQFFDHIGGKGLSAFANWESFFRALKDYYSDKKALIAIDEYPNIIVGRDGKRKKTDFESKLQDAIDHLFKSTEICLIIMGSNVSFMENIIKDKKGPLFERHTFSLFVSKLKWEDALHFVEGMSLDDKIKTLSLTDTYPLYLSHINPALSFQENLDSFFFNRDSLITLDPSFTISSSTVIAGFYAGIMRCISRGIDAIKAIADALESDTGKVSNYLDELIQGGAVIKRTYFNSSRNTYYEINDRMAAFFFHFVQPYVEHIKLGNGARIKEREENAIETFLNHAYEKLCISYLNHLNSEGKLETFFLDFANFKADKTSLGRSVEIDIVGTEGDFVLIGECKHSQKHKGKKEYEDMKKDAEVQPLVNYKKKCFYLFSHAGFDEELQSKHDKNLHLISSEDMVNNVR